MLDTLRNVQDPSLGPASAAHAAPDAATTHGTGPQGRGGQMRATKHEPQRRERQPNPDSAAHSHRRGRLGVASAIQVKKTGLSCRGRGGYQGRWRWGRAGRRSPSAATAAPWRTAWCQGQQTQEQHPAVTSRSDIPGQHRGRQQQRAHAVDAPWGGSLGPLVHLGRHSQGGNGPPREI